MNHLSPDGRILLPVGHFAWRSSSAIDTSGNSGHVFYSILFSLFSSPQLFLSNIVLVTAVTLHTETSGWTRFEVGSPEKGGLCKLYCSHSGCPCSKLWDLSEAAFWWSDIKDKVEEKDPDTAPGQETQVRAPSMTSSAVSPKSTMPSATASTLLLVNVTLEESHSILPVESLPLYDTGIPHELLATCGALLQGKGAYYCIQCTSRAKHRSTACTHVHHDHLHVSIGCPYCCNKVWSGDAWKQHMHHAHS